MQFICNCPSLLSLVTSLYFSIKAADRWGEGAGSNMIRAGCSTHLLQVQKAVLVPLRVFSRNKSTVGPFVPPLRVLSKNLL